MARRSLRPPRCVEVELAPDEVVEDDRPVAVLIDEVQLVAQDFLLLIRVLQSIVLEE